MQSEAKNLVIVLGPTGVGKSTTAIKLAQRFQGEIINCDSMQVYKNFDIGTDKPSPEKRAHIPHHLIDIMDPSCQFTAAEFVKRALCAAEAIHKRLHLPIIAGGTGLYLKAFLEGLFPENKKDPSLRERLQRQARQTGLESLRKKLEDVDPVYAQRIGRNDKIRIIRALEVYYATQKPLSEHFLTTRSSAKNFHIIKIGLKCERAVLYRKIEERVDKMFEKGLVEETKRLLQRGVKDHSPPFRALGYKQVRKHLKGEISLQEAAEQTKKETRHYAKRQMTWFRKMKGIQWFTPDDFSSIAEYAQKSLR